MIPDVEIGLDTTEVEKYLTDIEKRQLPFAASLAMNRSMIDAQKAVRGAAYGRVFSRRNKQLPKALTMIPRGFFATPANLRVTMMNVRDGRTGEMAGAGFINRQIEGRVKTPKGRHIAIPQEGPGLRRLKGGSVPAGKKPRKNEKLVKIRSGLYEKRRGGKLVYRYALAKRAAPNKRGRFRYHATGIKTIHRVMQGHWVAAMHRALRTAR